MKLTSKNVESIFMDCLFREGEDTSDPAIAEGIISKFGFHKKRLELHKKDILIMLSQLPKEFQKDGGGGMSFLNACNNAKGEQWTGLHSIMEQLFSLGQACEKVKCLMPRDMWSVLPGGMPYYVVL
uniref:Uncharacterized protein n=1 Tax=viral metagenome TaxID=1070528 RepID=A0A6M3LIC0_9ZZZZ